MLSKSPRPLSWFPSWSSLWPPSTLPTRWCWPSCVPSPAWRVSWPSACWAAWSSICRAMPTWCWMWWLRCWSSSSQVERKIGKNKEHHLIFLGFNQDKTRRVCFHLWGEHETVRIHAASWAKCWEKFHSTMDTFRWLQHPDVRGFGWISCLHLLLWPLPRLAFHPKLQLVLVGCFKVFCFNYLFVISCWASFFCCSNTTCHDVEPYWRTLSTFQLLWNHVAAIYSGLQCSRKKTKKLCSQSFRWQGNYADKMVDWWTQWLMCIPCGFMLACVVFKAILNGRSTVEVCTISPENNIYNTIQYIHTYIYIYTQ